jgi:hypothetical protein
VVVVVVGRREVHLVVGVGGVLLLVLCGGVLVVGDVLFTVVDEFQLLFDVKVG